MSSTPTTANSTSRRHCWQRELFRGATIDRRLSALRAKLAEANLDAILITQAENRRYLSGFTGSAGMLLISQSEAILATDFRYIEQAGAQAPNFEVFRTQGELASWFPELAQRLGQGRLGFEAADLSVAAHQELSRALRQAQDNARRELPLELVPTTNLVEEMRAVKDAEELALIERAVALSDEAFTAITPLLEPGWTELRLAWELERYMRERGSEAMSFEIIAVAGPRSSLPHARPTDRPIGEGEPIVIDMGARVEGYVSDMTRTLILGEPDDTFRRIYDLVLGAQLTAEATIAAGMTGEQAHNLALQVITQGGHGDAFGHGLGHGMGLVVHEQPRLGPGSSHILQDGMVFSVEPGIYLPGWGGVRLEDVVVLEGGRPRVVTHTHKWETPRSQA